MKRRTRAVILVIVEAIVALSVLGVYGVRAESSSVAHASVRSVAADPCAGIRAKTIVVSLGRRHLWACSGGKSAYASAVVTGYTGDPSNITPQGTYQIYAKQTDRHLTGSDDLGSWDDSVRYWMPFLDNQYGAYGFHDATWRSSKDFGTIDSSSRNASHGCVELPLAAAAWLYGWSSIGTTVVIQA